MVFSLVYCKDGVLHLRNTVSCPLLPCKVRSQPPQPNFKVHLAASNPPLPHPTPTHAHDLLLPSPSAFPLVLWQMSQSRELQALVGLPLGGFNGPSVSASCCPQKEKSPVSQSHGELFVSSRKQ